MHRLLAAVVLTGWVTAFSQPTPFQFYVNDSWLSLHQFLYALGMHEAGLPPRTRRAVVGAPADVAARLQDISAGERAQWAAAVSYYAKGPSTQDAVFDAGLVRATEALTALGDAAMMTTVPVGAIDPEWRAHLETVAPVYRRVWWPAHQRANATRRDVMIPLAAQHGPAILATVERAFGRAWPPAGFPVHLSSYASWAGAYSTGDNLLVVSSLDEGNAGLLGLETLFHEGMHQWDAETAKALEAAAKTVGTPVPRGLSHALIFFTAGAAVRRVEPAHVPYAEANDLWPRLVSPPVKSALDEVWQPFLNGRGTRAEALEEMLRRLQ